MKDFVIQNWYYLTLILIALVNMVLLIFRRAKVCSEDTIFEQLLETLPTMIRSVEDKGLTGEEKKSLVVSMATTWLNRFNYKITSSIVNRISESIENILSTPEKKGDK